MWNGKRNMDQYNQILSDSFMRDDAEIKIQIYRNIVNILYFFLLIFQKIIK